MISVGSKVQIFPGPRSDRRGWPGPKGWLRPLSDELIPVPDNRIDERSAKHERARRREAVELEVSKDRQTIVLLREVKETIQSVFDGILVMH